MRSNPLALKRNNLNKTLELGQNSSLKLIPSNINHSRSFNSLKIVLILPLNLDGFTEGMKKVCGNVWRSTTLALFTVFFPGCFLTGGSERLSPTEDDNDGRDVSLPDPRCFNCRLKCFLVVGRTVFNRHNGVIHKCRNRTASLLFVETDVGTHKWEQSVRWFDFLVSAEVGFRSGSLKCVLVELGGTSTCMHLHLQPCYGGFLDFLYIMLGITCFL